ALGTRLSADRPGRQPHPRAPLDTTAPDADPLADLDERLLEAADVVDHIDGVGQADNRITDELARPVTGDLAAAVDVADGCAVRGLLLRAGPPACRVDGRVFEQQEAVRRRAAGPVVDVCALAVPRFEVVDHAELADGYGPVRGPRGIGGIAHAADVTPGAAARGARRPRRCGSGHSAGRSHDGVEGLADRLMTEGEAEPLEGAWDGPLTGQHSLVGELAEHGTQRERRHDEKRRAMEPASE